MIFTLEIHELGLDAQIDQSGIHLQAFRHRTAVIFIRMDKQRRRRAGTRILNWGMPPQLFRIVVDIAALLVWSEGHADIGNAVERNPVGDAARRSPDTA